MDDQAVAGLIARWQQAEERLYPIVMVEPDRFTQIVSVVRAAADHLASSTRLDQLVDARRRGRAIVAQAAETVGVPVEQLGDVELVADAAFHLRHRELIAQQRRSDVTDAIAAARARGDSCVMVAESGRRDQPAAQPYERVEMCLDDGRALRGWIDVDPTSFTPVYGLQELRLDRVTGVAIPADPPLEARTYADREQWEAVWASWRAGRPR